MPAPCCQTCGRALPKRKERPEPPIVDISKLSDRDLYAYRKLTAPIEDVRFAVKYNLPMPADLRARWEDLAAAAPALARPEIYRRLAVLKRERYEWEHARMRAAGLDVVLGRSMAVAAA